MPKRNQVRKFRKITKTESGCVFNFVTSSLFPVVASMSIQGLGYYDGAKPGKRHVAPKTKADVSEKRAKYEKEDSPERLFNVGWCQGRPWLEYDKEKNVMVCTLCTDFYKNRQPQMPNLKNKFAFISGSNSFRLSTITEHDKSKMHEDALNHKNGMEQPSQTTAHKTLVKLNEGIQKQVAIQFRNVHALVKHNRLISDFVWLNELDKAKGFDCGDVYNNQAAGTSFLAAIF